MWAISAWGILRAALDSERPHRARKGLAARPLMGMGIFVCPPRALLGVTGGQIRRVAPISPSADQPSGNDKRTPGRSAYQHASETANTRSSCAPSRQSAIWPAHAPRSCSALMLRQALLCFALLCSLSYTNIRRSKYHLPLNSPQFLTRRRQVAKLPPRPTKIVPTASSPAIALVAH